MGDEILYERKLPVREIVADSYLYVWRNLKALILPLALLAALDLFVAWPTFELQQQGTPSIWARLAVLLFWILGCMALAVGIHRRILLGDEREDFGLLRPSRALAVYFWTSLKMMLVLILILLVAIIPISAYLALTKGGTSYLPLPAMELLPLATVLITLLLSVRFILALPGAAIGGIRSLRQSWRLTRYNWGRLIAALILVALPFQLPIIALRLISLTHPGWAPVTANVILSVAGIPLLTAAFSFCYRTLAAEKNE